MSRSAEPALNARDRAARSEANRRAGVWVLALPATVLGLVGLLVGIAAAGPVGDVVGAVVGFALGWAGAAVFVRAADGVVLRRVAARPATEAEFPRYHNLVAGLCAEAGTRVPALYVTDSPAANVLALGRDPGHAAMVATTGLVERLNLVELEGALARELAHIRSGDTRVRSVAVLVPALGRLLTDTEGAADVEGALLTRYPPGLAAAITAAADDAPLPGGAGVDGLWLVPAGARSTAGERVAALRDL